MIPINILSYFTKDITDPIEKAKYTIETNYKNIYIYYNGRFIFWYNNSAYVIYNKLLNIYKMSVYIENKCLRLFENKAKTYNNSYLSLMINTNHKITYRCKIKSYLAKYDLIYQYFLKWEFKFTIFYFNGYIYKYRNHFYLEKTYSKSLIFMSNKYELIFYSNLFLLFFVILMAYKFIN
jgi:hypothetical protein